VLCATTFRRFVQKNLDFVQCFYFYYFVIIILIIINTFRFFVLYFSLFVAVERLLDRHFNIHS